jgi:ubiquinone/menaquinone biosynthesis C-methylase UbiE
LAVYRDYIFPYLLNLVGRQFQADRRALMRHARGRVLELGVGTGSNLRFYPPAVTEVMGIDPHEKMIERARSAAARLDGGRPGGLPHRIRLQQADAQALPYRNASFDTVVVFLTLCTVPDPRLAADEAYRVLRPGGRLLVLEHVRAERGERLARWQDRVDPLWTRAAGGCHLNRDTVATLAAAGFEAGALERFRDQVYFPLASPRVRGVIPKDDGGGRE